MACFSSLSIRSCSFVLAFLNKVIIKVVTGTTNNVLQKLVQIWSGDMLMHKTLYLDWQIIILAPKK